MNRGPGAPRGGASEKPKDFKLALKRLFGDMKKYKVSIMISFVFAISGAVLTIIGPNQITKITDEIGAGLISGIDTDYVLNISILLFVIYGFSFIFSTTQGFIIAGVTGKYTKDLRTRITNKLNNIPLKYFDKNTTGDILSCVSNDVDVVSQSLNQSLGTLFSSIFLLIGVVIMMFVTNVVMTITALIACFIGFGITGFILSRSQKYFTKQQEELGKLNGHIEEIYSSHNVVKIYNASKEAKDTFDKYNYELFDSSFKSQFLSGLMMPLMNFIGNFGYVAVVVMGAYLTFEGHITIGVIVAYMIYIRLFMQPLSNIAQSLTSLQSATAASERIFNFLKEEELSDESSKEIVDIKSSGNIEFKNVKFGYNSDKLIINDFSLIANSGEKIAIVGPTGAGKTTLVNLLMRFYEINNGEIIIDGVNTQSMKRSQVNELFCMVLQDTWLFDGTIMENIKYNNLTIKDSEVKKVCKSIGIDHLIKSLPHGYDTILSDADSLSAGEKQLLTIARGMLKKTPFLILDEATSNVDTRTEKLVQNAMDKLTEGKTSFIIAHRLSTIKNADIILVLKEGNIVEQGNHEKLLELNGFYSDLYNSQFEE